MEDLIPGSNAPRDVRGEMNALWLAAKLKGGELKDPFRPFEQVSAMYRGIGGSKTELADIVLGEWVLADDEARRFDAVALIREFRVTAATPSLYELTNRLAQSDDPGAPFEHEKVKRLLSELEAMPS